MKITEPVLNRIGSGLSAVWTSRAGISTNWLGLTPMLRPAIILLLVAAAPCIHGVCGGNQTATESGQFQTAPAGKEKVEPLIKTHWGQHGRYTEFTPDHNRLGCWSVAYGQILYYHRLVPSGRRSYEGHQYPVDVDFENPKIDLSLVVPKVDKETPTSQARETARYLWYAAVVCGKDFGTGRYVGKSCREIELHYAVNTEAMQYPAVSKSTMETFVYDELRKGRPLYLYMTGKVPDSEAGTGHAVVIDGVEGTGDDLKVHLNYGFGGGKDGWYAFWSPINTFNNPNRRVVAVRPSGSSGGNQPKQKREPRNKKEKV